MELILILSILVSRRNQSINVPFLSIFTVVSLKIREKRFCSPVLFYLGWTVFQRRIDDTVDFKRDWFSYKNGFGNLQHEFWLGLENIFLVQLYDDRRGSELRMDFTDKDDNKYHEKYGVFELGDESTKYKIKLAGYSGRSILYNISSY